MRGRKRKEKHGSSNRIIGHIARYSHLQLGMGSPARPGSKIPGRARSGLHVGSGSGLISEPERQAGPGSGLHKTWFKPSSGRACRAEPGFSLFGPGSGPICKPEGRASWLGPGNLGSVFFGPGPKHGPAQGMPRCILNNVCYAYIDAQSGGNLTIWGAGYHFPRSTHN
jgi:hypothetical protein